MLALHLGRFRLCNCYAIGSPIGSGQGINNLANIKIIIENANIPVIVDAELELSEATLAMEMGQMVLLLNTAVNQRTCKWQCTMNLGFKLVVWLT
jgi:thiazole synthase